ncbi:MAG: helix-turn-helix domain-containing protein [Bdellovibrionota bacterium]
MTDTSTQLYKALLETVRSKVQSQKLTQAEIGKALGIKQSAISYLLSGRTKLTLEQFFALANLVGEKSYKLIADAEAGLSETRPMPVPMEEAMLKSPLHFLLYVAACRPVMPGDFVSQHFPLVNITKALEDLCRVDLLEAKDGVYLQKEPNVSYVSVTSGGVRKRFESLREIHRISQQVWMKNMENKEYRSQRFNHFNVSYLTNAQYREILELFWRTYEKLQNFEKENNAAHYSAEKYQLWNSHMLLMTPFEG